MNTTPEYLSMVDADVSVYRAFFTAAESDAFFDSLVQTLRWEQKPIHSPRLTAWYGDPGKVYSYSGITNTPEPWTDALLEIKQRIDPVAGVSFNSALCNLYRDGKDSIASHSDNERDLGKNPTIGSVSFGATRSFQFQHKKHKNLRAKVDLRHGDFLIMRGTTQRYWNHQIPKTSRTVGPRVNLTFRVVL